MKKIVLVMAVLMLATPALADVNIVVEDAGFAGSGIVAIKYESTSPLPRAFGLNLTVDSNCIIGDVSPYVVGESRAPDNKGYGIFPGTIEIIDGEVVEDGWGTPVSPNDFPDTQPGIGTPGVTIEMGSLYYPATGVSSPNSPDPCGLLCWATVVATPDTPGPNSILTISANVIRAGDTGVIAENPSSVPSNLPVGKGVNVCQGNCETGVIAAVNQRKWVNNHDVNKLTNYINVYGIWGAVADTSPDWDEQYNFETGMIGGVDQSLWINNHDVNKLTNYINTKGVWGAVFCPGPGF